MLYRSKIDFWIVLLLLSMTFFLLYILYESKNIEAISEIIIISIVYIVIFYIVWLPIFNTKYQIKDDCIEVKSMFFNWNIPLKEIININLCTSFLSAPALSISRVEIIYSVKGIRETIMISPKDRETFCKELDKKISTMKSN